MLDTAITKLNFTVDLNALKEYHNTLINQYEHLRWEWHKNGKEITEEWYNRILSNGIGCTYPYGWAIQSNLVDKSIPCPPYNISIHPRSTYEDTELMFGIVKKIKDLMPYTYRWSLVVQPPGGKVSRHIDAGDEYTAHIPIVEAPGAIFKFWDNDNNQKDFNMVADGNVYLVDTIIEHETENYGTEDRVGIVFRFKRKDLPKLLEITGHIT